MFGCRVQSEGNFPGPDIEPDPRGVIVAALLFILCFLLLAVLRSISFHGFRFPVPKLQCGNVFDSGSQRPVNGRRDHAECHAHGLAWAWRSAKAMLAQGSQHGTRLLLLCQRTAGQPTTENSPRKRGLASLMSRHRMAIRLVKHARSARAGRRAEDKMKPDPFSWILDEPLTFRNRLRFGPRAVVDEHHARDAKRLIGPVGSLA